MSNILITGGNSFFATYLYPILLKDHNVCCPFRRDLDVTNFTQLQSFLNSYKFDYVIHTAVCGNGKNTDKQEFLYNNLLMLENLLSLQSKYSKLFIFDSGASFDRRFDIFNRKENDFRSVPVDFYGLAKYINTKRVENNNKVVNLRIFNVFSPQEKEFRFIKTCIQKCLKNELIDIFDDIFFSFFYIDDLFTIINNLIKNPPASYFELNCVYPEYYRLSHTAELIKRITSSKSNIVINKTDGINYNGNGDKLYSLGLKLKGFTTGIEECCKIAEKL